MNRKEDNVIDIPESLLRPPVTSTGGGGGDGGSLKKKKPRPVSVEFGGKTPRFGGVA